MEEQDIKSKALTKLNVEISHKGVWLASSEKNTGDPPVQK